MVLVGQGERGTLRLTVSLLAAAAMGGSMALQTRVNGELGGVLADPWAAALWSFGSGFVIVAVLAAVLPAGRRGMVRTVRELRTGGLQKWPLFGGAIGASFVLAQSSVSPLLGVALFTVGVVTGQSIGGILTDRLGVGPGGARPVTVTRVIGALIMIGAVAWGASSGFGEDAPVVWLLIPVVIGAAMGWQQAGNGRIRVAAGTILVPTLTNFTVGTVMLAVCFGVHAAFAGLPMIGAVPPWTLLGGVIGVVYIGASAVLVGRLGVLLLSLGLVAGQVIVSLLIDQLIPASPHPLTVAMVGSAVLTVVAVAVSALPARSARQQPAEVRR